MTHSAARLDAQDLLTQAARLRPLARDLVRDAHLAEDVLQEALLRALQGAPADATWRKRWFRRVVRNSATEHKRLAANRAGREAAVARAEALPAADETAERLEAIEVVTQALRALAEPYRSTITRRYIDELSTAEIARVDHVDEGTIRWRIHKGLEVLRTELDQRFGGDRRQWCALLLPLAVPSKPEAAKPAGPLLGSQAAGIATATAAALVIVVALVLSRPEHDGAEPLEVAAASERSDGGAAASSTAFGAAPERTALHADETVELQIVHADSLAPIPGAEITWWPLPDAPGIESQLDSWFQQGLLEDNTANGAVAHIADENGRALVPAGTHGFFVTASADRFWGKEFVRDPTRAPIRVELRADGDVTVRVVDDQRRPVGGVGVLLTALGYCDDGSDTGTPSTDSRYVRIVTSDTDGSAVLRHVGYAMDALDECRATAYIAAELPGFHLQAFVDRDHLPTAPLEFALDRPMGYVEFQLIDSNGNMLQLATRLQIQFLRATSDPSVEMRDYVYLESSADGRARVPIELGSRFIGSMPYSYRLRPLLQQIAGEAEFLVDGPTRNRDVVHIQVEDLTGMMVTERSDSELNCGPPVFSGTLFAASGTPIGNGRLAAENTFAQWVSVYSETDGSFLMREERDQEFSLDVFVSAPGFASERLEVVPGTHGVQVFLEPSVTLHGRVLLDESLPPRNVWIEATLQTRERAETPQSATSVHVTPKAQVLNQDGSFAIAGLHPGTYSVTGSTRYAMRGYPIGRRALFTITDVRVDGSTTIPDSRLDPVDLRLAGGLATIALRTDDGRPLVTSHELVRSDTFLQPYVTVIDDVDSCSYMCDSFGTCRVFLPRTGARLIARLGDAFHDGDEPYFASEVENARGDVEITLTPRPVLTLRLRGDLPTIDEGFDLGVQLRGDDAGSECTYEATFDPDGLARTFAPSRSEFRARLCLRTRDGRSVPMGRELVRLLRGVHDQEFVIPAPDAAAVESALHEARAE